METLGLLVFNHDPGITMPPSGNVMSSYNKITMSFISLKF